MLMPAQNKPTVQKRFANYAKKASNLVGSPYWFFFSVLLVLIWIPSGFLLGWGEIWHLTINSTTTILTFLMMSLLHASQSKWEKRMEALQTHSEREIKQILIKEEQQTPTSEHIDSLQ